MNKIFRHKILAGAMLFGLMLTVSSCEDNEGIKVTPETPFADKTLYEVLVSDPDLTGFVEILNACGTECADSLFNNSRVYTLWAPIDPALDKTLNSGRTIKDSIMAELATAENRDHVFRTFVKAHIANHLHPANGVLEDNAIMMLNGKNSKFEGHYKKGYTFDGRTVAETNIRVKNGLIHKISDHSDYKYNIWEYLKIAENVDSVSNYLYSYDVTEFNAGSSMPGPIIDGEQTYIDSVFTTTNMWLDSWNGVGLLASEDSSYIVYVPSNKMWKEVVEKADSYFNYDMAFSGLTQKVKEERDSLRRYYSRLHNLKFMTYSENEKKYQEGDTLIPAYRNMYERPLFSQADLDKHALGEEVILSNGIFKVVDAMPFEPTDLYHDTIFLEGENENMWSYTGDTPPITWEVIYVDKKSINKKDTLLTSVELSGGAYYANASSSSTSVKLKVPKVLSAKYNVAIVFVPKNIANEYQDVTKMYPNKLSVDVVQELGSGGSDFLYTTMPLDGDEFFIYNEAFGLDTLFLTVDGKRDSELAVIEPKYSEFYDAKSEKDYHVYIELKTNSPNKMKDKIKEVDYSIRIDKIMLIPVVDSEE